MKLSLGLWSSLKRLLLPFSSSASGEHKQPESRKGRRETAKLLRGVRDSTNGFFFRKVVPKWVLQRLLLIKGSKHIFPHCRILPCPSGSLFHPVWSPLPLSPSLANTQAGNRTKRANTHEIPHIPPPDKTQSRERERKRGGPKIVTGGEGINMASGRGTISWDREGGGRENF